MSRQLSPADMAPPGSPEWGRTVTASKIPVILGMVPQWQTPSELWMTMSGLTEHEQLEGDHLEWGHIAEDSLVAWWLHKNPGWQAGKGEVAYTNDDLPFTAQATLDRRARRGRRFHIIEAKTSDSATTWDDTESLPGHVHMQVLAQQGISGIHEASVVSQLGSTVPRIYPVEWDPELWDGVVDVVNDFVQSLGNSEPPMPPQDLIDAAHKAVEPSFDDDLELEHDQVARYIDLVEQRDTIDTLIDAEKARLEQLAQGRRVTLGGKALMTLTPGRFAQKNLPDEARHLVKDPEVMTPKFDAKKFATKYPDIHAAALSDGAYTYRKAWK